MRQAMIAACALVALWASAASGGVPVKEYDIVKLADGVYAVVWKEPLADPIESNCLIVINDRDVVVVDACYFPSTARRIASEIKQLTPKPVRYVVNTHWHDDHHNGNQVYRELWPEAEFIAHRSARADMIEHTYDARAMDLANTERDAARYERWAASGTDDEGKPLVERRRKRAGELASFLGATAAELKTIHDTPPDLTFDDRIVLQRGVRTIEIRWLGLGNTRGDIVVLLPHEKIAATGDLLVQPVPFGIGSYYREWIATLGRIDSLGADVLVPGHGALQRDRTYLHMVEGLLGSLVNEVAKAVADSATAAETEARVTLDEWKIKFAGSDEALARAFTGFFVQPSVARAYHQAKGDADAVQGIE